MKKITLSFILILALAKICFGQMFSITLNPDNYKCGTTNVMATTGCNFNGTIDVGVVNNTQGITITNISNISSGSFSFEIVITTEAPDSATLNFELLTSDDPSGCAIPGQKTTSNITISCECNLEVMLEIEHESCFECKNGSSSIVVTGGDGNYTYEWSSGATGEQSGPLSPGTNFVVVTDGLGCNDVVEFVIDEYICQGFNIEWEIYDVLCYDECNGIAEIKLSNQSEIFSVAWSDGEIGMYRDDLCAGTYNIIVTDSDNCQQEGEVIIQQPSPLSAVVTEVLPAIDGQAGSIVILYEGSVPLLSSLLKPGNIVGEINPANNQIVFKDLTPDCYDISLEDENGCTFDIYNVCVENTSASIDHRLIDVVVFPNPSSDIIYIRNLEIEDDFIIDVFSNYGNKIQSFKNRKNIDISNLNSGIYYLILSTSKGISSFKFTRI